MRVSTLLICVLWAVAIDLAICQTTPRQFSTRSWFMKPHKAAYKKGSVEAKTNKDKDVNLNVDKAKIAANANVEGRGDFSANRVSGTEQIKVKSAKGAEANVDQSNKAKGERTADAGKFKGTFDQRKVGSDQTANVRLNTGQNINNTMRGDKKSFDAAGSRGNKYNLTPDSQTKTEGAGKITRNGETYNYKEGRASNGDTQAQLTNVGRGPQRKTYTCQGQKQGVSNCVDQNGLKVGEVVSQPDGTVIVKKTIAKGVDVPIGKSKVQRTSDGRSVATVNDGLFQARAGNYRQRDCMSDYGKSGSKIKIQKPFTFTYNSQTTKDGKREFIWPDCITFGGQITLPPGVDASRLAVQFDASILPAGKLKCVDPGSCNKDCYYCNFCNNSRKVDIMSNSDSPNLCSAKGGNTYDIRVTACPPPAAFNKAICSGFTKSDPTYFKKKGDLQARILFWLRPANEAKVKTDFHSKLSADTTGFVRKGWVLSYAVDNKNLVNANNPTNFDLQEWYIHKYGGKDEIVGCVEGTSNYTISGQKVRTDFLLEAGTLAAAPKSLFDTKTCPQVDQINEQQAQADAAEAAKSFTTRSWRWWGKRR